MIYTRIEVFQILHLQRHLMRTPLVICLALALSFFAGCARIPEPIGYEYTAQPKMQAAYHWDVLASDVANRINNELIIQDYAQTPVYVKTTCGDEDTPCQPQQTSTFNEAFRDLLITELVRFGVPVRQKDNEEAITVHYKVQLVYHHSQRVRTIQPGLLTSIAAGIMVLRNAPFEIQTIAAAGLIDYMNTAAVSSSAHEIIITTSIVAKDRYLFRTSDIYYINDKDFQQYQDTSMQQAAEIPLIGPTTHTKPKVPNNNEMHSVVPKDNAAQSAVPTEDATIIPDI